MFLILALSYIRNNCSLTRVFFYHVVLHINREMAQGWSVDEVIEHWHRLFNGSLLSRRYSSAESLSSAERDALTEQVNEWRERLMSISWFMRCANEPIAREANHEDNATGHFWAAPALHALTALVHPCTSEDVLSPRPYWMKKPWQPAWLTSTLTR